MFRRISIMALITPNMVQHESDCFFTNPQNTIHKQYEALRALYVEKWSAPLEFAT
jgi:hypothetical protein